jgi:uncharacterized protein (DUF697 family)
MTKKAHSHAHSAHSHAHVAAAEVVVTSQTTANAIVNKYIPWSMGLGFVPAPFLVAAGLVGIQLKMLSDIAKVYGVPFSENRGRSIVISLLGSAVPPALAGGLGGLIASIPLVGVWVLPATLPLLAGGSTYAVGKIFVAHFESGGTFLDFDPMGAKALFKERFAEGKAHASAVASKLDAKIAAAVDI